jgi:hypothetical protein
MKTPKRTCKPKSKKTIRTMTPLARKLAHLTRSMQSNLKRLAYLTEALYELERSEKAAQAQITGHSLVCPLATEPAKPAPELFPEHRPTRDPALGLELPNGEGVETPEQCAERERIMDKVLGVGLTESEVLQGRAPPSGCDPVTPLDGWPMSGGHHG